MNKIKVGAVSYLNTKPLLYGFKQSNILQQIDLIEDYPSKIAAMLLNNEIDLGLVPVAIINHLNEYHIVSDYCIGSINEVVSVALFSEQPIEKITHVYLDYQSRTSVNLTRILLKHFWKQEVEFIHATENYIEQINGTTAGLIIGDRALESLSKFQYQYDLSKAWKEHTGLPFVFAAWVANKKMSSEFIHSFNNANSMGIEKIDDVIASLDFHSYDLKKYFTQNISYTMDDEKRKGLALFLKMMQDL
ncbi:MAG: menaquinone biosynthesis protein [Chitinophagaceae bacterium]|nr:menaquinone biosynthesis protein [Chitinophagaceae bacterium]